jgi:hypothetical protein
MRSSLFRWLRVVVILFLVLLSFQFEFGMAINLSPNLTNQPAFAFSLLLIYQTLQTVGAIAPIHAGLGIFLLLLAIVNLFLALRTRVRGVQIFGILGLVSVLLAIDTGILFTLSGFQNDGYSHGMATNFLLTFIFFFVELYLLKPAPITN